MSTHLRVPTSGPRRMEALDKLALALFRKIGPSASLLLAARLDERCGEEAPKVPQDGREPLDGNHPPRTGIVA